MPYRKKNLFLLHPTRRYLYKILCETPGTYFYKLMEHLPEEDKNISTSTLLYHLNKLEQDNLIRSDKIDGKRVYFPVNLRNKEIERAFMLLKNPNAKKIFLFILNNEGSYQNQIAKALNLHHDTVHYHIEKLEEAKLIEVEREGKINLLKIGPVGEAILEGSLQVFSESYVRFIISKLADDCHFPEIVERTRDKLVIRVVCPTEDDIELSIDISGWQIEEASVDVELEDECEGDNAKEIDKVNERA